MTHSEDERQQGLAEGYDTAGSPHEQEVTDGNDWVGDEIV